MLHGVVDCPVTPNNRRSIGVTWSRGLPINEASECQQYSQDKSIEEHSAF